MPKAKGKKAKDTSKKHMAHAAEKSSAGQNGATDRPPESAEDFGHVLRRLMVARDSESRREEGARPER